MSKTTSETRKPIQGPGSGHGPGSGGVIIQGEKAKDFKGTFKKLVRYMGKYKFSLIVVMIFAIASTIFSIVGPKILGQATNTLFTGIMSKITGTGTGINFGNIENIILWLVGLYLISALFSYIQGYVMTGVSMKVTYNLRREIAAKIQKLPFQYYDKTSNGEVLSHITNDVDAISQSLNQSVTQIITSVTTIIGILIMMFSISWQMTLVAALHYPFFSWVYYDHCQKITKTFYCTANLSWPCQRPY